MQGSRLIRRVVVFNLAVLKFRVSLALQKSRFARSVRRLAQRGKDYAWAAAKHPDQIPRKLAGKFGHSNRAPSPRPVVARVRVKPRVVATRWLPIVFVHQSNSDYLKYAFAQAHQSNPNSTIYLLGDASNTGYEFVEHHSMFDYFRRAAEFGKIYRHYSTNSFAYELINFQRWFVLREFLLAHNLPRCLYVDSDTMLYANVTEDAKKFEDFDFTLSQMTSGCTFFLNRVEGLTEFCEFLFNIYSRKDKYHYDKMAAHYTARRMNQLPGGVCDMTAFQLYNEDHFGSIGEASHIIGGSVYDPAITSPAPGFEMANGIKKITWQGSLPYGKHVRTGREIKFNSLQFQGRSKYLMREYWIHNSSGLSLRPVVDKVVS